MIQEEKDVIFQDACCRIPYKPYAAYEFEGELIQVQLTGAEYDDDYQYYGYSEDTWGYIPHDNIKLYLRPLSSLTDAEFHSLEEYTELKYDQIQRVLWENKHSTLEFYLNEAPQYCLIKVFDWLNRHHFDYRGLIEQGLAIKVTKENNPYACNLS